MLTRLTKNLSRRSTPRRPRLQIEALEDRALLSASPFLYSALDGPPAGHSMTSAQKVGVMPMMETQVRAHGSPGASDFYRVELKKGETLTASVHATGMKGAAPSSLALWDDTGHQLIGGDNAHAVATDPSLVYRIQRDGAYYLVMKDLAQVPSSYVLDVRPIGLNSAMQDPSWLNRAGGELDVWLDGNVLDFSGPAGHGFGIRGNWHEITDRSAAGYSANYTASGALYLQTAVGDVQLSVPKGTFFSVTTRYSPTGQYFGELSSMTGTFTLSLNDLARPFGKGSDFGLGLSAALPQGGWGIKLGSDIKGTDAPLDAAVPYLYCTTGSDLSLGFGGVNVSVKGSGVDASVIADPADPFLYTSVKGLPGYAPDFAFAGSAHGLIPFVAAAQPDHYHGTVYGQVFNTCKIDLSDAGIPVTIAGDFVWNLDANHTGHVLGGAFSNLGDLLSTLRQGRMKASQDTLHRLDLAFHDLSFGHNGTGSIGWDKSGFSFEVPAVHDSDIFDGPAQAFYLHGGSVDPLKGTALAGLLDNSVDMDGYFTRSGQYDLSLSGDLGALGTGSKGKIELSNAGAHLDGSLSVLGTNVQVHGDVRPNGDFDLAGVADVNLLLGRATGTFHAQKTNGQTKMSLDAWMSALTTSFHVTGDVYANGRYALKGTASAGFFLGDGQATFSLQDLTGYTTCHIDAHLNVLGTTVFVSGDVSANGDFVLAGAAGVDFFLARGSATFTLARTNGSLALAVDGQVDTLGSNVELKGEAGPNGDFALTGTARAGFFLAGGTADLTFARTHGATSLYVDAGLTLLGARVELAGYVQPNGDFDFYTGAQVGLLGLVNASASFDFGRHAGVTTVASHLHAHYNIVNLIRGDLDADLTIAAGAQGQSTFSGSGWASVEAYYPNGGWQFWNWQWQPVAGVGLGVSGGSLWFTVDVGPFIHETVSVSLPH
jgi:hypothetical protein